MIKIGIAHIFFLLFITNYCISTESLQSIVTNVKTDKTYVHKQLNPNSIYSIEIEKVATTKEDESSKCTVHQKEIKSFTDKQKFRIGSFEARQKSIYVSLTTLPDTEDGIESFKILGDYIMVIMMNGSAFFLQNNRETNPNIKPINLNMNLNAGNYKYIPLIAPINGNAFVATSKELIFCQPALNQCKKIDGYKQISSLINIYAYEYKSKIYLFIINSGSLITYEVSTNGALFNYRHFQPKFFGKQRIFIYQIFPLPQQKLLLLDFYSGLIQVQYSVDSLADLKKVNGLAYEQFGCKRMSVNKDGQYVVLECSLTQKTNFILQLIKVDKGGQTLAFEAQQPIFLNEALTGIQTNGQQIIVNVLSGVKIFWSSTDIKNPYPYDFQKAGSVFLHNAKGSQLQVLNNRKTLYIYTEDEIRIYELTTINPKVFCYTPVPIKQQYKITYTYLCVNQNSKNSRTCSAQKRFSFEAIQYKQVGIKTTLLPLGVSLFLVLCIGICFLKLYRKYDQQIENARLRYNSNEQFGIQHN